MNPRIWSRNTNTSGDGVVGDTVPIDPKPFIRKPSEYLALVRPEGLDLYGVGILRRGQTCLLTGQGGCGKSTFALALAVASARGENSFAGVPLRPDMTTLFFNAEASEWRWQEDLKAAMNGTPPNQHDAIEDRIHIAPMHDRDLGDTDLDKFLPRLVEAVRLSKPNLVVIDTWARFVLDENDTNKVKETLSRIEGAVFEANPEAGLLIVMHAKPGQEAAAAGTSNFGGGGNLRGNKAIYNTVRAALSLAPERDDGANLVLSTSKCNDGPGLSPRLLIVDRERLSYVVDPAFNPVDWRFRTAAKRSPPKITLEDVVRAVRSAKTGEANFKHIKAALMRLPSNPSKGTAENAIAKAVDEGFIATAGKQYVVKAADTAGESIERRSDLKFVVNRSMCHPRRQRKSISPQ